MDMTKPPRTAKTITDIIGCDKLKLVKAPGYWYFVYDDPDSEIYYETISIFVPFLNQMTIQQWVDDGKKFFNDIEAKKARIAKSKEHHDKE